VSQGDVRIEQTRTAEKLLRCSFHIQWMALRTVGEFQALKARPVAGDMKTGCAFMQLAHEILIAHGSEVNASDIRQMRERIMRERAKE
jgi:hypothetical protein